MAAPVLGTSFTLAPDLGAELTPDLGIIESLVAGWVTDSVLAVGDLISLVFVMDLDASARELLILGLLFVPD